MIQINVSINVLPQIGNAIKIYMTIILDNNSLDEVTITSLKTLYGNVQLLQPDMYRPYDASPTAILVIGTYGLSSYIGILYTNAISPQKIPNNFALLVQKIPKGIFTEITKDTIIGQDMSARAMMIDDYYVQYFNVVNQVYSVAYSPELEFQYNGTVGLLSNSTYPENLFLWFSSLNTIALNSYDLELGLSEYIYYRIGISCPVYIDDGIVITTGYWNLGVPGYTELDTTTVLAPGSYIPAVNNLQWIIYNASTFTDEFKLELTNLVQRISRADVGNLVSFNDIVDPTDDNFTLIGFTYKNDPRTIYGKCTQYLGINEYPLNIVAYKKNLGS